MIFNQNRRIIPQIGRQPDPDRSIWPNLNGAGASLLRCADNPRNVCLCDAGWGTAHGSNLPDDLRLPKFAATALRGSKRLAAGPMTDWRVALEGLSAVKIIFTCPHLRTLPERLVRGIAEPSDPRVSA